MTSTVVLINIKRRKDIGWRPRLRAEPQAHGQGRHCTHGGGIDRQPRLMIAHGRGGQLVGSPALKRHGPGVGAQQARILGREVLIGHAGDGLAEDRRLDFPEVGGRLQVCEPGPMWAIDSEACDRRGMRVVPGSGSEFASLIDQYPTIRVSLRYCRTGDSGRNRCR